MKKTLFILGTITLFAACAPKTTEAVIEEVAEVAMPTGEAAKGKLLYEAQCQKCHKLKVIDNYSAERWDVVLPDMAQKAKLEMSDQALIGQYVNWELAN